MFIDHNSLHVILIGLMLKGIAASSNICHFLYILMEVKFLTTTHFGHPIILIISRRKNSICTKNVIFLKLVVNSFEKL